MNHGQLRRLTDAEKQAELITTPDDPSAGVEDHTINVVYSETFFVNGERRTRDIPATYADDVPFRKPFFHAGLKKWMRWRIRYPLEAEQQMAGPYDPPQIHAEDKSA